MPEKSEHQELNPRVRTVKVGIRALRKIKIYPLSLGDELELNELITDSLRAYFIREAEEDEAQFISNLLGVLKDNIRRMLALITDENPDALLKEMDNLQFSEIVKIIYEDNFEVVAKNLKSLFDQAIDLFLSKRPLPESASGIATDSMTSTENPSETEG